MAGEAGGGGAIAFYARHAAARTTARGSGDARCKFSIQTAPDLKGLLRRRFCIAIITQELTTLDQTLRACSGEHRLGGTLKGTVRPSSSLSRGLEDQGLSGWGAPATIRFRGLKAIQTSTRSHDGGIGIGQTRRVVTVLGDQPMTARK